MKKYILTYVFYTLSLLLPMFYSCKKAVTVAPPLNAVASSTVYSKNADAIGVLNGLYSSLASSDFSGGQFSSYLGLSADEFISYPASGDYLNAYYKNSLVSNPGDYSIGDWTPLYPNIYLTNAAVDGLSASTTLTPSIKQQLLGEAKFCRAFFYFYLVNIYGDVPMPVTSNVQSNQFLAKTPQKQIYEQIINDLTDAQRMLSKNFLSGDLQTTTTERVRPTYWAATSLLARVYLYYGNLTNDQAQFSNAVAQASNVIENSKGLFSLVSLDSVFLKNSNETIWNIQPTSGGGNSTSASNFIITDSPINDGQVSLSTQLLNAFENGDKRLNHWVGIYTDFSVTPNVNYYYPNKYKDDNYGAWTSLSGMTEYPQIMRLGEQYLIVAEADAYLGNVQESLKALNAIRSRAGLANYVGPQDKSSLLTAIIHERQVELFSELGQRWLDLKRTGLYKTVMPAICQQKGGTWSDYKALYPIPVSEILLDHNITQNPGY